MNGHMESTLHSICPRGATPTKTGADSTLPGSTIGAEPTTPIEAKCYSLAMLYCWWCICKLTTTTATKSSSSNADRSLYLLIYMLMRHRLRSNSPSSTILRAKFNVSTQDNVHNTCTPLATVYPGLQTTVFMKSNTVRI